jgi:TldD protein
LETKLNNDILHSFEEISNSYNRKEQYFDILYESNTSFSIVKSPFSEDISGIVEKTGVVARTFTERWYEYGFYDLSNLSQISQQLPKVSDMGKNISEFESWQLDKEIKPKTKSLDIPIADKIAKIREIFKYVVDYDERIFTCRLMYGEHLTTKIFVNNEGCRLKQVIPRTKILVLPIAREGKTMDYDYMSMGAEVGFEIFDEVFYNKLDKAIESSIELLKAENPPDGNFPIILDADMAGLIAHESFGHGLEADQILRERSYLKPYFNKKVASEICNIYDTPNLEKEWGFSFFDDEGVRAGNNILVENGILKNYIYDRRTASRFNTIPQGNGRREGFTLPIHPRMTNTYFGNGDYDVEEMISEVKDGVMLIHGSFGMEDPLGGSMQCTSKKGYLIKNGEKSTVVKQVALSGYVLDFLQNIDAVSKDKLELRPGTCGKGHADHVPVTSGGSYLRVKKALISPG